MGRSQEFDTTAVVAAALDVFWARGYEGALTRRPRIRDGAESVKSLQLVHQQARIVRRRRAAVPRPCHPATSAQPHDKSRGRRRRRLPFLACARDRHHDRRLTSARLPTSQYGCRTRRARRCGGPRVIRAYRRELADAINSGLHAAFPTETDATLSDRTRILLSCTVSALVLARVDTEEAIATLESARRLNAEWQGIMTGKLTPLPAIRRVGDDASRAQVDHAPRSPLALSRGWTNPRSTSGLSRFSDPGPATTHRPSWKPFAIRRFSVGTSAAPTRSTKHGVGSPSGETGGQANPNAIGRSPLPRQMNSSVESQQRGVNLWDGTAELAYWVTPAARGRGLCTQAVTALSEWAFREVGFHRLELAHSIHNPRSCRVATKAGFSEEGVRRSSARHADGWHDMHVHARLRSDQPSATTRAARASV